MEIDWRELCANEHAAISQAVLCGSSIQTEAASSEAEKILFVNLIRGASQEDEKRLKRRIFVRLEVPRSLYKFRKYFYLL